MTHRSAIAGQGGGAAPWWLAGGIDPSYPVWAYAAKGAATYAASLINLAQPGTYNAAPGAAGTDPAWTAANGWQFDGSTDWLTTGFLPVDTRPLTMIFRFSGGATSGDIRPLGGCGRSFGRYFTMRPHQAISSVNNRTYVNGDSNGGFVTISSGAVASGVMCIAGAKCYYNGVMDGTIGTISNAEALFALRIGMISEYDNDTLERRWWLGYIQAAACYSAALSDAQVIALTIAMGAL